LSRTGHAWLLLSWRASDAGRRIASRVAIRNANQMPIGGEPMSGTGTSREVATLGGGCFWCLEAVFELLKGVEKVESGYAGGSVANPIYKAVCRGDTGHAEVVQVTFDPSVISFREILDVFFAVHDPTTINRQGNDVGTQYRSAIFFHS